MHYASVHNHVDVAKRLLEAGVDENGRDLNGYTALNLSMGGEMCRLLHKVKSREINKIVFIYLFVCLETFVAVSRCAERRHGRGAAHPRR